MGHWWQQNKGISEQLLCQRCCQPEPHRIASVLAAVPALSALEQGLHSYGGSSKGNSFPNLSAFKNSNIFPYHKRSWKSGGKNVHRLSICSRTAWLERAALLSTLLKRFLQILTSFIWAKAAFQAWSRKKEKMSEWECQRAFFFFLTQKTSKQEAQLAEPFSATIPVQWIDSFCQKISDRQQPVIHTR